MSEKPTYEQLEDRLTKIENEIKDLRILYNAATGIRSNLSFQDTMESVTVHIIEALNSAGCTISRWHRDRNQIETLADHSKYYPDEVDAHGKIYDLKDYPATLNVLETGQSLLIQVDDLKADKAEVAFMREQSVFTNLVVPLKTKSRVWGLLEIYEDVESRVYSKREIRLAESLASRAAVALENAQLHEDMQNEIMKSQKTEELEKLVLELEKALLEVKTLKGFIPICASCKKIRDDSGYWNQIESYIKKHSDAEFSHSICPDCVKKLYPNLDTSD